MKNITGIIKQGCPQGHVKLKNGTCKKVTAHHTAYVQFWFPKDAEKAHKVLSENKVMNFSAHPFTADLTINRRERCPHNNPLVVLDILRDAGIHTKYISLADKNKCYYERQFSI